MHIGGQALQLPSRELELLCALAENPTRVFRKEQLLMGLCGHGSSSRTRALDSHACHLRRRVAAAAVAGQPPLIRNVSGVGYRLLDG